MAQLFDQGLALLVSLDKREQVRDYGPECLFGDGPGRVQVHGCVFVGCSRIGTINGSATATQLTYDVGHCIVNDEAVVSLRQLVKEQFGESAYLRVFVDGTQGDLVYLAACFDHFLEDEM